MPLLLLQRWYDVWNDTLERLNASASWFIVKIQKRCRCMPLLRQYFTISVWKGLVCHDFRFLLFQVELVEYLHGALQDLIYIVHTIRITFHGQIDERDLKRDHVLWWHVLARLKEESKNENISNVCLKLQFEITIAGKYSLMKWMKAEKLLEVLLIQFYKAIIQKCKLQSQEMSTETLQLCAINLYIIINLVLWQTWL